MESLRAAVPFTLHKAASAQPEFEGWGSVFGNLIDAWTPTRILPGAFAKTIRENAKRIKILYQHDHNDPIGIPIVLREEARGLYLRARLSSTARGQEIAQLMRDGVLTELSIGFDPIKHHTVRETIDGLPVEVRHVSEVRLWEISVVTFAANSQAVVTAVHRRTPGTVDVGAALADINRAAEGHERRTQAARDADVRDMELRLVAGRLLP